VSDRSLARLRRLAPVVIAGLLLLGHAIATPLLLFGELPKTTTGESSQEADSVRSLRDSVAIADAIAGHSEIGYVSEQPVAANRGEGVDRRFRLAQFALAPVLLEDRVPHALVLADFENPAAFQTFMSQTRARPVVDVAPGRALVRMGSE